MKRSLFFYVLLAVVVLCIVATNSCKRDSKRDSKILTVHQYLENIKNSTTRQEFPFELSLVNYLPEFNSADNIFVFEKSLQGDEAYFYEGSGFEVKKVNIRTLQNVESVDFPSLADNQYMKFEVLDQDLWVWYGDSTLIHVYNNDGEFVRTINLPLSHQNFQYHIYSGPQTRFEFFPEQKTLIIPINCVSEYDEKKTHSLPRFAAYNFNTSELEFIPIYLPDNYSADKYLGELMQPITAQDGTIFYTIYPLNQQVYKFDVVSKSVQTVSLQLPVSLTAPAALSKPANLQQMGNLVHEANRIQGFAVLNGVVYVQQTGDLNDSLASKNFIDNTVLYAFDGNGQLIWSGAFPNDTFDNAGIFTLSFAKEGKIHILANNRNNEHRLFQLTPQL